MGTSTINAGSAHSRSATTGNGSRTRGADGSLARSVGGRGSVPRALAFTRGGVGLARRVEPPPR